jgi:hypothetical protein
MLGTPQPYNFKNRIINGNFGIWQRGTSSSSAGYLADRWQLENAGTYSQSSDVPSDQGFPYSCTVSVTSGTAYGVIKQKIEAANCTDLVGQNVTVSFWVKNLTGSTGMYAILYYANSANNFGSVTAISTQTFTAVLNTWTKFTFNWNSLPAGVANGVQIYVFSADAATAPSYRFTGAQLELGVSATSFDFRSIGTEIQLCQRYYQKLGPNIGSTSSASYAAFAAGYATGAVSASCALKYNTTMRTNPTISQSGTGINVPTQITATGIGFTSLGTDGAFVNVSVAGGLTTYQGLLWVQDNNVNGYVDLSAEL